MMGYRYAYRMMPLGLLFWLVLIVIIILIAAAVYKSTTSGKDNKAITINDNAIEILKQRFAKGEIDEEQYKKMRDTIEK